MSCVVAVSLGSTGLLLTGDVPAAEEAAIIAREPGLRATWLAAPHHGSRSSSSMLMLAALAPEWAVAQAGYRNRFGHPDAEVVARYRAQRIRLLRTDHSGALQWRFRSDGRASVNSWRSVVVRYWHNRPGEFLPVSTLDEDSSDAIDTNPAPPEPFFPG